MGPDLLPLLPHSEIKIVYLMVGLLIFRSLVKIALCTILLLYIAFVIIMYSSPAARELMIYLHPCKCIEFSFSNFLEDCVKFSTVYCFVCCFCLYLTKWRVHLKICPSPVPLVRQKILSIFIFLVWLVNWEHGGSFDQFYISVLVRPFKVIKKDSFLRKRYCSYWNAWNTCSV